MLHVGKVGKNEKSNRTRTTKGTRENYSTRGLFPLPAREEPGAFADGLRTLKFAAALAAPAPLAPSGDLGELVLKVRGGAVALRSDLTPWGEPPTELGLR